MSQAVLGAGVQDPDLPGDPEAHQGGVLGNLQGEGLGLGVGFSSRRGKGVDLERREGVDRADGEGDLGLPAPDQEALALVFQEGSDKCDRVSVIGPAPGLEAGDPVGALFPLAVSGEGPPASRLVEAEHPVPALVGPVPLDGRGDRAGPEISSPVPVSPYGRDASSLGEADPHPDDLAGALHHHGFVQDGPGPATGRRGLESRLGQEGPRAVVLGIVVEDIDRARPRRGPAPELHGREDHGPLDRMADGDDVDRARPALCKGRALVDRLGQPLAAKGGRQQGKNKEGKRSGLHGRSSRKVPG